MIFTKGNIALRPFKYEDFEITLNWRQDTELRKLAQFHNFPVTSELEKEWIESVLKCKSDKAVYYAIENTDEKKLIGYFHLKDINWVNRVAWLGIIIGDLNSRGKGYGKTALELGLKYAFNYLNLRKISLEVLSVNKAAVNLYQQSGFTEEGLLKKHVFFEGGCHDIKIMSLFNNELNLL